MTEPASTRKTARKQYTPEFRDEALKLAERIATSEFSLYESQLYDWRSGGVNARKTLSFTRIPASSTAQRIIRHY